MPDLHELRQTYGRMADAELLQLAVEEAADLTPEAADVLGEELCKRGFSNSVGVAVAAQRHQWTPQEIDRMVSRLQQLPCPTSSATGQRLNGAKICTVKSFLVVSQREQRFILGCPDCIERAARSASAVTWAIGWWCFPWGPLRTISTLIANAESRRRSKSDEPTQELKEYVVQNPGQVALILESGAETMPN